MKVYTFLNRRKVYNFRRPINRRKVYNFLLRLGYSNKHSTFFTLMYRLTIHLHAMY